MASATSPPTIAERTDIHKSCKTLEVVVNILNDYCEAANAVVVLQKKLAKALRDAATTKCTENIPASALIASATIFEALSEVDTKFAKIADKECDAISAEVKKWFKKLAKEERAHDERIAAANARIRQAGQTFEKKSKRSPRDAAEEHTRYMNLLSTLGPEVNQDKYNHALLVTQKHSTTIYNLAACLSRVADAEWLRSCEGVRRFAPTVGQLGEWRALCEGGWSGPVPPNLVDAQPSDSQTDTLHTPVSTDKNSTAESDNGSRAVTPSLEKPIPEYTSRNPSEQGQGSSRAVTPSGQSPIPPPQYFAASHEQNADNSTTSTTNDTQVEAKERTSKSSNSLASLDSFPTPPTHFPIPPINGVRPPSGPTTPVTPKELREESTTSSRTSSNVAPFPRLAESPIPEDPNETQKPPLTTGPVSPLQHNEVLTPVSQGPSATDIKTAGSRGSGISSTGTAESALSGLSAQASSPAHAESENATDAGHVRPKASAAYRKGDYVDDAEFGVRKSMEAASQGRHRASGSISKIERSDTGKSNGSVVAAMRDRYSRTTGPASQPPKDVPRLPTSVTAIATKYEAPATPSSPPRPRAVSPGEERRRLSLDTRARNQDASSADRNAPVASNTKYTSSPTSSPFADELSLRRQRIEELEELDIREQELQLRMKEREIEQRALELERDRLRLLGTRGTRTAADGYTSDSARSGTARHGPPAVPHPQARYHSYSLSTTHLVPPSSASSAQSSAQRVHPSSQPPSPSPLYRPADHAPYCGCDACSASQYKSAARKPSPRDLRPPEAPPALRPEKPKGWIRRLSMPVMGGAFSLDSKKGVSNAGIAGGPGYRSSLALTEEDGRFQADYTGGISNRSMTNLARR
ncbi:hypothetical protein CERSUDRAFT_126091 [Gelatoporia subvermispora B]|uniref:IMD domain-containing protein n=1 Tax=Ceriporiopsis subvermispora (strain B) TaxID=914234 RepID=M2Q8X6_CERS8|nr:hypothetical protein CERSUDRAFT_126091 [Gelatoporia subvermispora B]